MNCLKRITACALVAAIVFQLAALQVSAATALTGYSGDRHILRINITSEFAEESDFVKVFPKELYLGEGTVKDPLEQMANSIPKQYEDVPSYFQLYYSDILYGDGTVETSGSSITALAMMATYLTGYSYYPDELSHWFAGKADDDIARLSYASEKLGLPFEVSQSWQDTYEQLQAGKYIVIQTDPTSVFSDSWHFVVLKGMTEDGKILVNDPCVANLIKEELKEKYITGFAEIDISTGFQYAWIFDKNKVPDDIARYTGTAASKESRYAALKLTLAERQLLARAVYANAYGECEEGQQMMVEVILNRMLSNDYSDELKDIVCGEDALCDVSRLNEAKLTQAHYLVVERALFGPYLLEKNITDFSYTCHE